MMQKIHTSPLVIIALLELCLAVVVFAGSGEAADEELTGLPLFEHHKSSRLTNADAGSSQESASLPHPPSNHDDDDEDEDRRKVIVEKHTKDDRSDRTSGDEIKKPTTEKAKKTENKIEANLKGVPIGKTGPVKPDSDPNSDSADEAKVTSDEDVDDQDEKKVAENRPVNVLERSSKDGKSDRPIVPNRQEKKLSGGADKEVKLLEKRGVQSRISNKKSPANKKPDRDDDSTTSEASEASEAVKNSDEPKSKRTTSPRLKVDRKKVEKSTPSPQKGRGPPEQKSNGVNQEVNNEKHFRNWLSKFGDRNADRDPAIRQKKLANFVINYRLIREHNERFNAGEESFELELNQFADMSPDEIEQRTRCLLRSANPEDDDIKDAVVVGWRRALAVTGNKKLNNQRPQQPSSLNLKTSQNKNYKKKVREVAEAEGVVELPENFDWRTEAPDCVQPAVEQGACPNCYAFAAIASIEWNNCLNKMELVKFSEQQATDCTFVEPYSNKGCLGGKVSSIFHYVGQFGFLCLSESDRNRYYANRTRCAENTCDNYRSIGGMSYPYYHRIANANERTIMEAVYTLGPVTVEMDVDRIFHFYKSGVYSGELSCDADNRDHAMLIVGWGTDSASGKKYWILRNSWSDEWGDAGHVKVERGKNVCGIEAAVRYPLISS